MADDYELPPNTCSPDDPVYERVDVFDSENVFQLGFRATACNATWLCAAFEAMGLHGPNYPLTWAEHVPEPDPVPDNESSPQ